MVCIGHRTGDREVMIEVILSNRGRYANQLDKTNRFQDHCFIQAEKNNRTGNISLDLASFSSLHCHISD